jgi:hypothetical protein
MVDRGQALTFEGVIAGILLLAAISFALQVTAVTPLSPSTSSQHVENQLQATNEGMLTATADSGALKEAVLYWDPDDERFHGAQTAPFYRSGPPDNAFGDELTRSLGDQNVAFNVFVYYYEADSDRKQQRLLSQGRPSDHAVSASRTFTLTDGDRLVRENGTRGARLDNVDFYIPDAAPTDETLYNTVRVEVIAWRI